MAPAMAPAVPLGNEAADQHLAAGKIMLLGKTMQGAIAPAAMQAGTAVLTEGQLRSPEQQSRIAARGWCRDVWLMSPPLQ